MFVVPQTRLPRQVLSRIRVLAAEDLFELLELCLTFPPETQQQAAGGKQARGPTENQAGFMTVWTRPC